MPQQTQTIKKSIGQKKSAKKVAEKEMAMKHAGTSEIDPGERHRLIAETAYFIAEQRGFQGDMAMSDWLAAEAEVDARFAEKH